MKGFIRQDLYHLALNMKFYLVFILCMCLLVAFSDFNASFLYLYILIFSSSALLSLFSYDEASHWQAYAATAPNGRKALVDGRYLVGLLLCLAIPILTLVLILLSKHGGYWSMPIALAAMLLLYIDLMFPLSYRFGNRSRLILLIVLAVIAGGAAVGGSRLIVSSEPDYGMGGFDAGVIGLSVIGLLGMVISHQVSVSIMEKKEF